MAQFRADYQRLKTQWGGYSGYDAWVARANNATLALQASYDDHTPAFMALFERAVQQGDGGREAHVGRSTGTDRPRSDPDAWPRFYDAVRRLSELPKAERDAALQALVL